MWGKNFSFSSEFKHLTWHLVGWLDKGDTSHIQKYPKELDTAVLVIELTISAVQDQSLQKLLIHQSYSQDSLLTRFDNSFWSEKINI
jgi:hypothetical protein